MSIVKDPRQLGEEQESTINQLFTIPDFCLGEHLLVKLAPAKGKGVRDGLVSGYIMTSYRDVDGNNIELVTINETASGYEIKFPLGKKGLYATKFRGPKNIYRFLDKETNKFYQVPNEKFTLEAALKYCKENVDGWADMDEDTKSMTIDEYFSDLYMFGLSQDLNLPTEGDNFTEPFVGLQTKLYRTYTPPKGEERWGNIIISKWKRGQQGLDSEFKTIDAALAEAIYEEYQMRETGIETFDPTKLDEADDEAII